ncbi:MAG: ATP-binding protein [Bryobacteraceae bacterium]
MLVEMLEHPDRYEWARVEADDAGFLDDVVALRVDGVIVARQVKFSAHPDDAADPYSWDDLLKQRTSEKGNTLLSLLSKWGRSFLELKGAYAKVEASLFSNRRPGDDLWSSFAAPGVVDLERISDATLRDSVVAQLGGEQNAREFFAAFRFQLDLPNLEALEEGVLHRFMRLHGDLNGWKYLKDELRMWVRDRHSPPPDGRITLAAVKGAARWQPLEALPEDFAVPPDFVIPDDSFHGNLKRRLRTMASGCVVVTGPPGIGKSTYISNLYRELRETDTPVVRHHFFLSRDDPTPFRYDHLKVASSLMSELQTLCARLGLELRRGNPRAEDLPGWLSDSGGQISDRGSRLVVILDGLDHVWRDAESITDLSNLFQLLTPIPRGVILLIGTQPVDASRLPRRLSEIAPRETWLDLPALEYTAVRRWAQFHASELRALRDGDADSHRLDELAGALWRRSEGHPLHLGYLLKSLEHVKGYITARDVERLPDAPQWDITRYYSRFWEELPHESKQVLCLLATCDFPWSRRAIAQCLYPERQTLAIDAAIRQVAHLTAEGPLGLQFAHTSLQFFVRQHADYQNYAALIREMALEWLKTRAPGFSRWSYEWLLAAEGGDEEPLLRGPSRSWLIEGMARRYPKHTADRILTRCAGIALQRGQLDRFVEVALLSDYLSEAVDSRDYIMEPLLAPQLAIREDETIVDRSRGKMNSLGNLELLCLAECCQRSGMNAVIEECFDRLNARIRAGQAGRQDVYPRMNAGRCLARVAAFAPKIEPRSVLDWIRRQERTEFAAALWEDYTDSLRAHRQADRLRAVVEGSDDLPAEKALALSRLVLLACEDGFDVLTGCQGDSVDPFVVLARALRGEPNDSNVPVQTPGPWVLRIPEYEFFGHYDEMAEYFWRMFFVFTANCLLGKQDLNIRLTEPFADRGWIGSFLDCSAAAASNFAQRLRSKEFTRYSWIFAQLSEVRQPDYVVDRTGHGFAVAARKAIFRLAMDLQALQAAAHSPAIDGEDIEVVHQTPLFLLQVWMEITVAYRRTWFTADGLMGTLRMIESELGSTAEDFGSRAELCALAAELAASHATSDAAAKWVRECWSNLVAYGYHKDMLLDQCLDAAEHLQEAGWARDALDLLVRLAPAISAVGEYTDGDETGHLPRRLGRLLFEGNLQRFVKYHEWLCARGEYWDAHSIFETFVSKADLGNRVFQAVAETAVERENLLALAGRSDKGDRNAAECLRRLSLFHVPSGPTEPQRDSVADREGLVGGGPMPDPGDFPPEKFEAYRGAAEAAGSYRVDEDVDGWARYWRAQGHKKDVLEALEAYDSGRSFLSGDSKVRFELTMEVRGKQGAYQALVAAQRRRYGWNRYFSQTEEVRYVWTKLREIYPEKWLAFLQSTLMSDPGHLHRSGVTVHSYISRLVEFLLFMEHPDMAKEVARAATETTLQLVPLNLPAPTWIPGGGQ